MAGLHAQHLYVPSLNSGHVLTCFLAAQPLLSVTSQACMHTLQDVQRFLLLACAANLVIFIAQIPWMVRYHLPGKAVQALFVLFWLDAVEPFLPAVLTILMALSVLRLRRQGLYLADGRKLYIAAQVDCVLFDKTGTLTAEQVTSNCGGPCCC